MISAFLHGIYSFPLCRGGERYHLTEREIEVVQSVSEGLTNEDVARRLFISRFTVENHLKSIFEKTGVKNRTELASRTEFP